MGVPDLARYIQAVEMPVDEILTDWMRALGEQAGVTAQSCGADHHEAQSRKGKTKPSRRRRSS